MYILFLRVLRYLTKKFGPDCAEPVRFLRDYTQIIVRSYKKQFKNISISLDFPVIAPLPENCPAVTY